MKYNIGQKIRKIREDKSIKQEELANFLGIKQSTLSKIENGYINIEIEQIINIAYFTKAPIYHFFPDDLVSLQQIDFRIQLQELHQDIKIYKNTNNQLLNRIYHLEKQLEDLKYPPPYLTKD